MPIDSENRQTGKDLLLTQVVKEVYTPGIVTFGHGTRSEEFARGILEQGLYANKGNLTMNADTLISPHLEIDDHGQIEEMLSKIHNWPYHNEAVPFLVLIQLPLPHDKSDIRFTDPLLWEQAVREESNYFNSAVQALHSPHKIDGIERQFYFHIPREYIRGFINRQTGVFTANPHYDANLALPPQQ